MKRPYEGKVGIRPGITLAPGKSKTETFTHGEPLDKETSIAIRQKVTYLFVLGRIGYTDDLGIYRDMGFCRIYDTGIDRFRPVDDPDYESPG
jgi:hypothetical protein